MKFDPKKLNALSVRLHGKQIGVMEPLCGRPADSCVRAGLHRRPATSDFKPPFKGRTGGLVTALRRSTAVTT
jgi:hypothetical protein